MILGSFAVSFLSLQNHTAQNANAIAQANIEFASACVFETLFRTYPITEPWECQHS